MSSLMPFIASENYCIQVKVIFNAHKFTLSRKTCFFPAVNTDLVLMQIELKIEHWKAWSDELISGTAI